METLDKMLLLFAFMFLLIIIALIALAWIMSHDTKNGHKPYQNQSPEDNNYPPKKDPEKAVDKDGHFLN